MYEGSSLIKSAYDQQVWPGSGDGGWYGINRGMLTVVATHNATLTLQYELREDDDGGDWVLSGGDDIIGFVSRSYGVTGLVNGGLYGDFDVSNGDGWGDNEFQVFVSPAWTKQNDIYENYSDDRYNWTSKSHDIYDNRLKLTYQWVSQSHDIYDQRPRYEVFDLKTKVVTNKSIVQYQTLADTEQQTIFSAKRIFDTPVARPFGAFDKESILATLGITIQATGNITLSAIVNARLGNLTANALGTVTVVGSTPTGATDANTVAAIAQLLTTQTLSIVASNEVDIADSVFLGGTHGTSGDTAAKDITITGSGKIKLGGKVFSSTKIIVTGNVDVDLNATLIANSLLQAKAGQGTAKAGSINGNIRGDYQAISHIELIAGALDGDITLSKTTLSAAKVTLNAVAGAITHGEGLLNGGTFVGTARDGIKANSLVQFIDATVTSAGDIIIANAGAVTLTKLDAANGKIAVLALGSITATNVVTRGGSDSNDIELTTFKAGANINVQTLAAHGAGDITLVAQGGFTQTSPASGGAAIIADALDLTVSGGATLYTQVNSLNIAAQKDGNVTVNQSGSGSLRIASAEIADGSFTVNHPLGAVVLESVELLENKDANDVSVTAGGNIQVSSLKAGDYYPDRVKVPDSTLVAESGINAHGDIFLTSGGSITESGSDAGADLVGDDFTLQAETGISGLELAANELLSVKTTTGDIDLSESDRQEEKTLGLVVTLAEASAGSVTVKSQNRLTAHKVIAGGVNGFVRLTSVTGNLEIVNPGAGQPDAIQASGVALIAGGELLSYKFFQGPRLIEYRAGGTFNFNLPASLTADTIIIEMDATISISGAVTAKDRLELVSNQNVFVSGTIVGAGGQPIGNVIIKAKGQRNVTSSVFAPNTGMQLFTENATGDTVQFDAGHNKYYKPITGGKHVLLGLYTPAVSPQGTTFPADTRTYFANQASPLPSDTLYTSTNGATFTAVNAADRARISDLRLFVWEVTASITDAQTQLTAQQVSQGSGFINIQTADLSAAQFEIRALRNIFIKVSSNLTFNGFVGGLNGSDAAGDISLRAGQALTIGSGTVAASGTLELQSGQFTAGSGVLFVANALDVITAGNVTLNTRVNTLTLTTTGSGTVIVNEADAILLESVIVANGGFYLTASGNITATYVRTLTDGFGNDVTLTSTGSVFADDIEAGANAGANKTASRVTLDAQGTISEPLSKIDNTSVDVSAYKIILIHGQPISPPKLLISDASPGLGSELEIAYVEGWQDGQPPASGVPAYVNGNYTLNAAGHVGDLTLTVTGNLTVVALGLTPGQLLSLTAGGSITIVPSLNVGSGTIILSAGTTLTSSGTLTAGSLTATSANHMNLSTNVDNLTITELSPGKNVTINETNSVNLLGATLNGGDLTIQAGATINVVGTVNNADSIYLTGGSVTLSNGLTAGEEISLTASGTVSSNGEINTNALKVSAAGSISLTTQVSSVDVKNTGANGGITINESAAGGELTINRLEISNASNSGNISLSTADGTITIAADEAGVSTAGSGSIALTAGGGGDVEIDQDVSSKAGGITITAGNQVQQSAGGTLSTLGGGITMTAADSIIIDGGAITAGDPGDVTLASGGAILQTNAKITADVLTATAVSEIRLNTTVATLFATTSAAGPIVVTETNAITLASVKSANGPVTVSAGGSLVATQVISQTTNDANDISLTTTGGGTITAGTINAGAEGDVTLTSAGAILDSTGKITAYDLTATGVGGMTLDTNVTTLTATSSAAGIIVVTETDGITLTNVQSANGPIAVSAGGSLTASQVISATNHDANDISLTSAAEGLIIGNVNAGSQGDVALTSGATIEGLDGSLVLADQLEINAADYVSLRTTVARVAANVGGTGNLTIRESDNLTLLSTITAGGDISISSTAGSIFAGAITVGPGRSVSLSSLAGLTELNERITANDLAVYASRLTVHVAAVRPFPTGGFTFHGANLAGSNDILTLVDGSASTVTHTFSSADNGTSSIEGDTIVHVGIEAITDVLQVDQRVFNYTGDRADDVLLTDDGIAANKISRSISSSTSMTLDFTNPNSAFTLNGGDGNDVVTLVALDSRDSANGTFDAQIKINGENGDDTIDASAFGLDLMLNGGAGADQIKGGKAVDTINGGAGDDVISSNEGDDIIHGDGDKDIIHGNSGVDTIYGDAGDDRLFGDAGNDAIYGGDGADWISGGHGNDLIESGAGKEISSC